MTMAEAYRRYEKGQEKELKRDVLNWLNLQGAWVFTQRMFQCRFRSGALCKLTVDLATVKAGKFRPRFVWSGPRPSKGR